MAALIQALLDPRCYPHPVGQIRLIETHISWLLLTGSYAYKIKKPVALGFADFSTLARRRHYCAEEVRLNGRFAPHIYLGVVPIAGTPEQPRVAGTGTPIEYAVLMREFEQDDLLDRQLHNDRLEPRHIDALADACSAFHTDAPKAPADSQYGMPDKLLSEAIANFEAIDAAIGDEPLRVRIQTLKAWTLAEAKRLNPVFARRRYEGRIRECHGDLHLGNIARIDGRITMFDCIEFNADFRWIDVMSELAFTVMDLAARGRPDYGRRLLNRYLEASGDYGGLEVLRFYLVYRAMVRAKVDCIRAGQEPTSASAPSAQRQDFLDRITLAERFARPSRPFLAITCGLSGSGKTHVSQIALERTGAIRLRSDVERKRLFGLSAHAPSRSPLQQGIYDDRANDRTFRELSELARRTIECGYPVIVDATFILRRRRQTFADLAASLRVPFAILHCRADDTVLVSRLIHRQTRRIDASEAGIDVMRRQQSVAEALADDERRSVIEVDGGDEANLHQALGRLALLGGME